MFDYTHTTKDGERISLQDLKTPHLKNIIARFERLAISGVEIISGDVSGDGADAWGDIEVIKGKEVLENFNHHIYVSELKRRQQESQA